MTPLKTTHERRDVPEAQELGGQEHCLQSVAESIVAGLDPDELLDHELVRSVRTGWYKVRRRV